MKNLFVPLPGIHRSATQPMPGVDGSESSSTSIADRLAALHHSGTTNWKQRVVKDPDSTSVNLTNKCTIKVLIKFPILKYQLSIKAHKTYYSFLMILRKMNN